MQLKFASLESHTYFWIKSIIQVIHISRDKHSNLQENNHIHKYQEVTKISIQVKTIINIKNNGSKTNIQKQKQVFPQTQKQQ